MLDIIIDRDTCDGCGHCALACPTNCIDLDYDSGKAVVADIIECIVCRNCEEECPRKIIEVKLEP